MERLKGATVAVFGVGGVGSFAAEALARTGVGHLVLIDNDTVCMTNINRQIHATTKTIGKAKTLVMKERIADINPEAEVTTIDGFFLPESADDFFPVPYDYVIDAIDTVSGKIGLVLACRERSIPIISCMGAGNKLDPTKLKAMDISRTTVDPIARVMRKKLKELRVPKLKVVCSTEKPLKVSQSGCGANCICPPGSARNCDRRRAVPGSISFVPSVAGLILAGEVIRDLCGIKR